MQSENVKKNKVSIIVPVYNVESCLETCIESVMKQTYSNLEILLVDDGSTDHSSIICDNYAGKDERIKVIHKKNGGLSDARNRGIEEAIGEFLLFVDSDDYIVEDAVEKLLAKALEMQAEIVFANAWQVPVQAEKFKICHKKIQNQVMAGKQFFYEGIKEKSYMPMACFNLYKTEFIKKNNLYFKTGILHEDTNWMPKVLLKAEKVLFYDYCFYFYIIRENSITQQKGKEKNIQSILDTCYEQEKLFREADLSKKEKDLFLDYLVLLYLGTACLGENTDYLRERCEKAFVWRNTKRISTLMKTIIFCINIDLYRLIKKL